MHDVDVTWASALIQASTPLQSVAGHRDLALHYHPEIQEYVDAASRERNVRTYIRCMSVVLDLRMTDVHLCMDTHTIYLNYRRHHRRSCSPGTPWAAVSARSSRPN